MLVNYAIYKKLEKHFDARLREIQSESFSNVWKVVIPILVTYLNFQLPSSTFKHSLIIFLLFLLLFTFRAVRNFFKLQLGELWINIMFMIGVSHKTKKPYLIFKSLNQNALQIKQELYLLLSLNDSGDEKSKEILECKLNLLMNIVSKDIEQIYNYLDEMLESILRYPKDIHCQKLLNKFHDLFKLFTQFVLSLESNQSDSNSENIDIKNYKNYRMELEKKVKLVADLKAT